MEPMIDYQRALERYRKTLQIAVKHEAVPMMLETLVKVAECLYETDQKDRAAHVVTLALCYPLRMSSRMRAEQIYLALEKELDPVAMQVARELANDLTLDDMVEIIIAA